jgi:hypothetical protein
MQYPDENCTFDYQSFPELVQAENFLIDTMREIIPEEMKKDFAEIETSQYKNKFIDLSMKLTV